MFTVLLLLKSLKEDLGIAERIIFNLILKKDGEYIRLAKGNYHWQAFET
jgi:hypothetical protein